MSQPDVKARLKCTVKMEAVVTDLSRGLVNRREIFLGEGQWKEWRCRISCWTRGQSTTTVRRDLVPEAKITGEEISIRCAQGDTVIYPLAEIEIEIGGRSFTVEAAVVEKLPVSVLLGRDVPELVKLLQEPPGREAQEMQEAEARDEELFAGGKVKTKLSRKQKRAGRVQF